MDLAPVHNATAIHTDDIMTDSAPVPYDIKCPHKYADLQCDHAMDIRRLGSYVTQYPKVLEEDPRPPIRVSV